MTKKQPTRSKRDAILDAMLDIVMERGFHDAPMSLLARRSGASAGVIYHHFKSKEELLQALYERVHARKRDTILAGYSPEADVREAFIRVWTNVYHYTRQHLAELRFLEQYELARRTAHAPEPPVDPLERALLERFTNRSRGGVLNELPTEVLQEISIGAADRLAKLRTPLDPATLRTTAEQLWEAIRAQE